MQEITILDKKFKISITAAEIEKAVDNMAVKINADYINDIPIFVAVLNGSFMFASDLLKKIKINCNIRENLANNIFYYAFLLKSNTFRKI